MIPPAASESVLAESLRRWFRAYRYAPISPAHGLVRRLFRSLIARHQRVRLRNGLRLELDLASVVQQAIFWLDGDYDLPLQWVIRELLPLGTACVDCGANCGYIGLLARRFREAPVWFVEPHPRLAAEVRRNVTLNGWDRDCTVVEAAASDHDGEATCSNIRTWTAPIRCGRTGNGNRRLGRSPRSRSAWTRFRACSGARTNLTASACSRWTPKGMTSQCSKGWATG